MMSLQTLKATYDCTRCTQAHTTRARCGSIRLRVGWNGVRLSAKRVQTSMICVQLQHFIEVAGHELLHALTVDLCLYLLASIALVPDDENLRRVGHFL